MLEACSVSLLHKTDSDIWLNGERSIDDALSRGTHLGIGAHQDDLEFMAYEGIAACYEKTDLWFVGVTVTDGRGSSRAGPFKDYSDEQIREVRREEQRQAAEIGQYSAQLQLDYPSSELKGDQRSNVTRDLYEIISRVKPSVVYVHQPADKHDSHVATLACSIDALRQAAEERIPDRVVGCEVWRGLDWLDDAEKIPMVCDQYPDLVDRLYKVFRSQIEGGKRYDLAVEGRRRANATMFDSHGSDMWESVAWGIDLKPLLENPNLSIEAFIQEKTSAFAADVRDRVRQYS